MSEDARGELIKGARPNVGPIRGKRGKSSSTGSIPTHDTSERDRIIERLKEKK